MNSVIFYYSEESENKGINGNVIKELTDAFNLELINAFEVGYFIVSEPGPNVLLIRVAITDIKQSKLAWDVEHKVCLASASKVCDECKKKIGITTKKKEYYYDETQRSNKYFFVVVLVITATPAVAMDPIPDQAGFSGFIRPGAGYLDIESNMVAEFASFELSDDPISSRFDSPDGESTGIFLLPFNVAYTFSNLKTQVFLGTQLTDLVRFDLTQQLGVKQEIGGLGLLQVVSATAGVFFRW